MNTTKKAIAMVLAALALAAPLRAEAEDGSATNAEARRNAAPGPAGKALYRSSRAGIVMCKGDGGAIAVADMRAEPTEIADVTEKISRFLSSYVEARRAELAPGGAAGLQGAVAAAFAERAKEGTCAVIAIADCGAEAPGLAVFPEDRVAVVNASRLAAGADAGLYEKRLGKEIWRGVAFALGGYASEHPCALKAVDSLADLDNECLHMTCPPVNFKAMDFARKAGVAPYGPVPYGMAVRRGVAPAPTNELQRAVWEAVKADMATNAAEAQR